jgi:carboxyl-terminal processing protease
MEQGHVYLPYRLKGCLRLVVIALIVATTTSLAYLAGFASQRIAAAEHQVRLQTPETQDTFQLFWEAWDIVRREFYGPLPSTTEMVYGAIRGALSTLDDPHTAFITREEALLAEQDLSGSFEGIGATVDQRNGQIVIIAPLKGTPAERAGLRPGDIILAIDGESLEGASLLEAVMRIRGPRGTQVVLTIQRPGRSEPFDVTLIRERIEIPTVEGRIIERGGLRIAYVRLFHFNERAPARFRATMRELLRQSPDGVILDLRDNPGGFLHVVLQIADEFFNQGVIVREEGKRGVEQNTARPGGLLTDPQLPLAVLVNEGSASASEILAGALQDRGRGVLIGETTFGKGSVQISRGLSDGSQVRVTIARWLTPDGRQIHGQGLQPDIFVPLTEQDRETGLDPQLDRALEWLADQR